ncbi:MAG: Rieske (2Fe-2S) protein [Deltaproteobacteria bacterium]|nr:Rieske (2Fe-2S) protein [Deltaproteobacteria bacterium]
MAHVIARLSELQDETPARVSTPRGVCAVVRVGREVHVLDDTCPHRGGSLGQGSFEAGVIVCPLHRWAFRVDTGRGVGIAAATFVERFPVEVVGDEVISELA